MKKAFIIVAVLVVIIAALAYYFLSNLNSLVAGAIEKNGSDVTRTDVSVSGVDIAIREGRGSIKGLRVANPSGFKSSHAFSLDDMTVEIDIKSLREDPIIINEIRILAPTVNAEVTKTGASNIDELRTRVASYSAGSAGDGGESGGAAKRIRIKEFIFEKGVIEIDATALGLEKRTVTLSEIRLSDVGGHNGAPPGEIAQIILTAVAGKAASEISNSEINRLLVQDEARVWVLRTRDPFFGITRAQDWEWVASGLRELIDEGEYPETLWGTDGAES